MVVIGVDSGSLSTGYGVVEGDGRLHRTLIYGAIRNDPGTSHPQRLAVIRDKLREVIREFHPQVLALEGVFVSRSASSALKLGQVRGAVMLTAMDEGLEIREFSPAEVKMAVTGYGRADKEQVQAMVKAILGLPKPPKPHDAADALALALCALQRQAWDRKVGP